MKATVAGTVLALAAASLFVATRVHAQEAPSGAQQAQVKCVGGNDCKGKSACKTATNPGPGQNSCKGQGLLMTSTEQECKDKGGHVEKM